MPGVMDSCPSKTAQHHNLSESLIHMDMLPRMAHNRLPSMQWPQWETRLYRSGSSSMNWLAGE